MDWCPLRPCAAHAEQMKRVPRAKQFNWCVKWGKSTSRIVAWLLFASSSLRRMHARTLARRQGTHVWIVHVYVDCMLYPCIVCHSHFTMKDGNNNAWCWCEVRLTLRMSLTPTAGTSQRNRIYLHSLQQRANVLDWQLLVYSRHSASFQTFIWIWRSQKTKLLNIQLSLMCIRIFYTV